MKSMRDALEVNVLRTCCERLYITVLEMSAIWRIGCAGMESEKWVAEGV
jgi:hypothetical protein